MLHGITMLALSAKLSCLRRNSSCSRLLVRLLSLLLTTATLHSAGHPPEHLLHSQLDHKLALKVFLLCVQLAFGSVQLAIGSVQLAFGSASTRS